MRETTYGALVVVLAFLLVLSTSARGESIGFNFVSDRASNAELGPDEVAGVVPQQNWNNFIDVPAADGPYTWNTAEIGSPNVGVITADEEGTPGTLPEVTVSWTALHSWDVPSNGAVDSDDKLMNGYLDNDAGNPQITITVENLPSSYALSGYSVIAYIGSDENGRTGTVGITDGETFSYSTNSDRGGTFPEAYVQTTDTAAGNPAANYAMWEDLDVDNFTVTINRGSNNSGFHGLQIIANPDGAPTFAITNLSYNDGDNSVDLTWSARAGRVYAVEASDDLVIWNELDDGVAAKSDIAEFRDEAIPAGSLTRYYRVRRIE